jgi:hypothetical protein
MAAVGPPIGPGPGIERPPICLSNGEGSTCPEQWLDCLADCMRKFFDHEVRTNSPFKGGFIIRSRAGDMPWIQVEISRAGFYGLDEKRDRFVAAVTEFCARLDRF